MSEQTVIDVHDMSAEDVRRELFVLLGYRLEKAGDDFDPDVWHVLLNDERIGHIFGRDADEALENVMHTWVHEESGGAADEQIPDWPNDPAAALAVCMGWLRLHDGDGLTLGLEPMFGVNTVAFYARYDTHVLWAMGNTDAEALARLALRAYRGEMSE